MSRKLRVWFPGAMYHITSRGNKKEVIFYDEHDYQKYLSLIAETKELLPFHLLSYCIMNNHTHLLIETNKIPIQDIMKQINSRYAIYFNKRHDLCGHVFQGRYKSKMIIDRSYFLNASRYIHLNPLEANLVTKLEDYPWSSFPFYLSAAENPLITREKLLSQFPKPSLDHYLTFLFSSKKERE
jgi:putative transposase